uniref:Uncharacterized protein n=1 Tax=Amphimedon queenslandica TaxID=400682 RepID=A0A1X7UGR9_AMPQE
RRRPRRRDNSVMSSHSFTVDNKAAQKKKVNDDIEMALGIVTSLSENRPEISEISRITDKFKESSVWKEVESSLNYFKSITNPEDTNALSLVAFINEGKLRQFCYNIILLGSYIDDRQCFDVDKRIQNLQKYIKDAVLWIRDEKPVAKPCKLIQSNIYELENILSSWKDASIFLESEVIIQNKHKFMLMRQEPLLLLRTESETCRIQQSYSVCVTNLSQKLLSLSVKIGSLQPCSTINQLCNLFLDINSEITPLLEVVNGFYKWSLATNFVDYKYIAFATLIDWCSHVITLHQERSIFLNQTLSQLVFMLESMRDILPKECITVVNTFEHDKARILDGVVSVRSVLLHATNIKEFQNDFVPNCYQVYVQFLENCMKLRAPSQDSWLTTGMLNVDSNSIKVLKNLLFNLNWELRRDFLMAK